MNRRLAHLALLVALASLSLPAAAQRAPRVGYLVLESIREQPSLERKAFLDALAESGWVAGKTFEIVYRSAENEPEFLPDLCEELVREKVDVLATVGVQPTLACLKTTRTVPIAFLSVGDPISIRATQSLGRPGLNATGVSSNMAELAPKRVELMHRAVPAARRVAFLWDQRNVVSKMEAENAQAAARKLGIEAIPMPVGSQADLQRRFAQLADDPADALYVCFGPGVIPQNRTAIAQFALGHGLALISAWAFMTDAGGLLSYSPNMPAVFRRAAYFVDRILKGTPPQDLPIEQMRTIDLVINLDTARRLGLELPPELLLRANRVIE